MIGLGNIDLSVFEFHLKFNGKRIFTEKSENLDWFITWISGYCDNKFNNRRTKIPLMFDVSAYTLIGRKP